jgi:hypothetical protein
MIRVLLGVVAAIVGIACGHSSPTERGRLCRLYPTAMTVDGRSLTCSANSCTTGRDERWTRQYRSWPDFVLEARAPNRRLVLSEGYTWQGHWAWMGSGGSETEYRYDGVGQLAARRRTSWGGIGNGRPRWEVDRTEYEAWDYVGRPVAGTYWVGDQATPVSIWYDDASRTMRSSIGELAVQDQNGNLVREIEIVGGRLSTSDYVIEATAEACFEP